MQWNTPHLSYAVSVNSPACLQAKRNEVIKTIINSCGFWFLFLLRTVEQRILWLHVGVCACVCKRESSLVWRNRCTKYLLLFSLFWMPVILSFPLLLFQLRIMPFSMLVPNRMSPAIIKSHGFSYSAYLHLKAPEYFQKNSAAQCYGGTWSSACLWFVCASHRIIES